LNKHSQTFISLYTVLSNARINHLITKTVIIPVYLTSFVILMKAQQCIEVAKLKGFISCTKSAMYNLH